VIAHQDFLDNPPSAQVHITTKEPEIAADMVLQGSMTSDSCVNYADITNQRFYMVSHNSRNNNLDCEILIMPKLYFLLLRFDTITH